MNVWFRVAKSKVPCSWASCQDAIEPGEAMVISKQRGEDTAYWHTKCLLSFSESLAEGDVKPGRRPLGITDEVRRKRNKLLSHYAANKQRIAKYKARCPDTLLELRIHRLLAIQQLLRLRITEVGGLPRSWQVGYEKQECREAG